jgi:small subunit ribosomal protein S16
MAVSIRLTRNGSKKVPFYRVVAADRRSPRDGRFIEQLGVYDPLRDPPEIRIDQARFDHWVSMGALPSQTVIELVRTLRLAAAAGAPGPAAGKPE